MSKDFVFTPKEKGLDLKKLDNMLDEALEKETKESLNQWLSEKDTEETVIQGWVCRDKKYNALNLHAEKPYRAQSGYDVSNEPDWWESDCASFLPLDKNLFPDLTWDDDPIEVEIIIKRKKNEHT